MKTRFSILLAISCLLSVQHSYAQCASGTTAQINWDNLDFYYVSTGAPYGNGSNTSYVTAAHAATQKFAIGKNTLTFSIGANITINGENTTNTAEAGSFGSGADAQFTTTAAATTMTLTFNSPVSFVQFSIYDLDANQRIAINAKNTGGTDQTTTLSKANALAPMTFNSNPGTNPRADATSTSYANNDNLATLNVQISGEIKTITITTSNAVGDFWISDITACVTENWTNNYHQLVGYKPFNGQPDYFLVTPDNNSVYMLDPVTGRASWVFTDAANTYVNSFGYDPANRVLYYVTDGSSSSAARNNKALKKYDFNTETISTVMSDINASLNIPTFEQGVESAAAAFYDGYLFLGIEGGRISTGSTRETIIYRITLNASGVPTEACQVFGIDAYNTSTNNSIHDWGDFLVKDGVLVSFNTARQGTPATYPNSAYHHFNLNTGAMTTYLNPTPSSLYSGQGAMDWEGNAYTIRNTVARYFMNGTVGTPVTITSVSGPAWVGSAGDASEPFRPKMDFGDAPASYDPVSGDPAVHEMNANLRLGATFDREWTKVGAGALANADGADEDGLPFVHIFNPNYNNYLTQVNVFNNTGANATVCAWLDYNGNGVFDAAEGISVTVGSSASMQSVYLYWPSTPSSLPNNSFTFLRIRVAPASAGMTTANATGYISSGEVEDYRVAVNSYPLNASLRKFDAQLSGGTGVVTRWAVADETEVASYAVEKSINRQQWDLVSTQPIPASGAAEYSLTDQQVYPGTSYYRLRIVTKDGKVQISEAKRVEHREKGLTVTVLPNPVVAKGALQIRADKKQPAILQILDAGGAIVHKENLVLQQGLTMYELPVASKLPAGTYTARIQTSTSTLNKTIIVNK